MVGQTTSLMSATFGGRRAVALQLLDLRLEQFRRHRQVADHDPLGHRRIRSIQLVEERGGCRGPGERPGIGVVLVEVAVDGGLQVDQRAEDAAAETA